MPCGFLDAYVLYADISNLARFHEVGLVVTILVLSHLSYGTSRKPPVF